VCCIIRVGGCLVSLESDLKTVFVLSIYYASDDEQVLKEKKKQ
jgi:hypothetical protein